MACRTERIVKMFPVIGNIGEGMGLPGGERESNFGNVEFELLLRYPSDNVK